MLDLDAMKQRLAPLPRTIEMGRVTRVVGLTIEASGLRVGVGEMCRIHSSITDRMISAEVVGFDGPNVILVPLGEMDGLHPGSSVEPLGRTLGIGVGPRMLGRAIDALGRPIDNRGKLEVSAHAPLSAPPTDPMLRDPVNEPFATGVRAIDGLLTFGRGQRVGIFAGSGVGKSTLLGMIARHSSADINVIALVGERNREVQEFKETLGPEGLARSILVIATGEQAALMRVRCAMAATAIAEHFRDQGKHVLLMMDSVTRVAMAWREIGLAAGEPPTTKGYPPSVFAHLPRLLERAGTGQGGAITGIYTVLVDGDDHDEPVADAARSILDGHVVLTRKLVDSAHYPAIDILKSKSRVRDQVVPRTHRDAANSFQRVEAAYRDRGEELILVGAYQPGSDAEVDTAVQIRKKVLGFLRQEPDEHTSFADTQAWLSGIAEQIPTSDR